MFTVYKDRKVLVTEQSMLAHFGSSLCVWSDKTQYSACFVMSTRETDAEGDVLAFHFIPTQQTLVERPALAGWKLVVLND
jgi:hypothetical protein